MQHNEPHEGLVHGIIGGIYLIGVSIFVGIPVSLYQKLYDWKRNRIIRKGLYPGKVSFN